MLEPRSTQSAASTEPARHPPRKGRLAPSLTHPVMLLLAGLAVLLGAYALGYLPQFGSLLEDAIRSSQSTEVPVLGPAVYGIAGLAAFLIMLGVLKSVDLLLRKLRNTSPLKARPAKPVEQFIAEAAAAKIGLRVARESYYLLEPQYPNRMCIDLGDSLRSDLHLPDEAITALDALLRARCDRRPAPVNSAGTPAADPAAQSCVTVFDLLQTVEAAAALREDRSGSRDRAVEVAPIPERRLSDSAQRKALHAATLVAIETGSLHTAQTSGLHRRASDYSGPRRRATDNRTDPEFKGPYRRAADHAMAECASAERASAERPATERVLPPSGERKPVAAPDPAELNRRDPLFVPPRNKRVAEPRRTA